MPAGRPSSRREMPGDHPEPTGRPSASRLRAFPAASGTSPSSPRPTSTLVTSTSTSPVRPQLRIRPRSRPRTGLGFSGTAHSLFPPAQLVCSRSRRPVGRRPVSRSRRLGPPYHQLPLRARRDQPAVSARTTPFSFRLIKHREATTPRPPACRSSSSSSKSGSIAHLTLP